jgi:hypothetical protein
LPDPPVVEGIASPINLLLEEQEAREVLVLSYTLNLDFWERYALSLARGLGAAVTVVGDAAMVGGDPAHVRYAGSTYLDGRAVCRTGGAFHPKLVVIAGESYATVAIGSGNATIPGWHDNAELWSVVRGDSDGCPETFRQLARWLRNLDREVLFSAGVGDALVRVADRLGALPVSGVGPQLVSSLERPIIDQLPSAPADELTVAAPFHDRNNAAIAALAQRLEPKTLRVLLQPGDAVLNGAGLVAFLERVGGEAFAIAGERYHHGKLYEWVSSGRRYALTGSPNLSTVALAKTMVEGGNCELGLVCEVAETVAPETGEAVGAELSSIVFAPREPPPPAILLLGASRMGETEGIDLVLRAPLEEIGELEFLINDVWQTAATVPAGQERASILGLFDTGRAVRVRRGELISNVCFVTDLGRVRRVRIEHKGRVRTDEVDVFADPKIAEGFALDLAELRGSLQGATASDGGRGESAGAPGSTTFESWESYLDRCSSLLGERLLAYGLALPALDRGDVEADDPAEDPDAGDVLGGGEPKPVPEPIELPVFDDRAQRERRRYQRWCERLAEVSERLPPPGQCVALRLMLRAVAGRLFTEPAEWIPLIAQATQSVAALPSAAFDEERAAAASLGAVALSVMRGQITDFAHWGVLRSPYERAAEALHPLLPHVDDDRVDRITAELKPAFPAFATPGAVQRLVESRLQPDMLEDAIRSAAEEYDIVLDRNGLVLVGEERIAGDPRRMLLQIIGLAEKSSVAVSLPTSNGGRAIAAWISPDLILIRPTAFGRGGAWYTLRGFGPSAYQDVAELPRPKATWSTEGAEPEDVVAVLELLGIGSPASINGE